MAGDPFGLLLRQRIVFLGGEASLCLRPPVCSVEVLPLFSGSTPCFTQGCQRAASLSMADVVLALVSLAMYWYMPPLAKLLAAQVNDFSADAIISQLLLLDSQDPSKVCWSQPYGSCGLSTYRQVYSQLLLLDSQDPSKVCWGQPYGSCGLSTYTPVCPGQCCGVAVT